MRELPQSIIKKAFQARNGEYAWQRTHIIDAMCAIAENKQAILGGEVWLVKDRKITGLIPGKQDGQPSVWGWETSRQKPGESWRDYCNRIKNESIMAVTNMKVEENIQDDLRDFLFFNVTYKEQNKGRINLQKG